MCQYLLPSSRSPGVTRPGSALVHRSPGCRCKATPPTKHGPHYQMRYTRNGESSSRFVKKDDLPAVRKQPNQPNQPTNCERMKLLMARWIDLATEWSSLRLTKETG